MPVDQNQLTCICAKQGCRRGENPGIKDYCKANHFLEEIEKAKNEYRTPGVVNIYEAACVVGAVNDGFRPRIEEALDFARHLKFSKIGFAACNAFMKELEWNRTLFTRNDLEVVCAACQIGRVSAEDRGVARLSKYINAFCNPIAQAEILNSEGTQLNFIVGLCMGHDILFTRYSKAPVSTLIVKDRMTGNNPAAALYGYHTRRALFGLSREDDEYVD
jgi:uncharacterized metal-binding protein